MTSENDKIRKEILMLLYNQRQKARSLKKVGMPISAIKKELKNRGFNQQQVVSNLDYLIQTGWVAVDVDEYDVMTNRGVIKRHKKLYKLTDLGIAYFEGTSEFQRIEKTLSGINVTNIQGVTIIGDGNTVVNRQYVDVFRSLSLLEDSIRRSNELSDTDKLNYIKDIETIKNQLSKPQPNKDIIKIAWEKVKEKLEGLSSFIQFIVKISEALEGVI